MAPASLRPRAVEVNRSRRARTFGYSSDVKVILSTTHNMLEGFIVIRLLKIRESCFYLFFYLFFYFLETLLKPEASTTSTLPSSMSSKSRFMPILSLDMWPAMMTLTWCFSASLR